jgi:membrane protein implicated in regulation of membrane protease activity
MFTSGFFLACLGVGALAAACVAALGLDYTIQLIAFILASIGVISLLRPVALEHFQRRRENPKLGIEALIGRDAVVVEEINPQTGTGRVKVGGEDWRAIAESRQVIPRDRTVNIERVVGASLYVRERRNIL